MNDQVLWTPTADQIAASNIGQVMSEKQCANYEELHQWSVTHKAEFLEISLKRLGITFQQEPADLVARPDNGANPGFLEGASFNIVESCFKNKRQEQTAIRSHNNDGQVVDMSFAALQKRMGQIIASLESFQLSPGDRIAIAIPMHSEAIAIFLAIIAAGYSAAMIAESFSSEEIATRLEIAQPKLVFTQDSTPRGAKNLPLYEKVTAATELPCVVLTDQVNQAQETAALREQDISWDQFLVDQSIVRFHSAGPQAEIMVLFSSGTTGTPKAIPWTQSMPLKSAIDGHFHHDLHAGDVAAWPTSLGWMMGGWLVFASLLNGSAMALSSHAPTTRAFGVFIQDAQVTMLGLVPSLVAAWRHSDCMNALNWDAIRAFSSTGECSNADDMAFLMALANNKPIIEYCGGTETSGGYITGTVTKPCIPGTFSAKALGFSWLLLDEDQKPSKNGEVFFECPVFGLSERLLNADHHKVYFADTPNIPALGTLRRHGDQIEDLGNGYYRAHGRTDDSMNLGGIKVGAIEIENLLAVDQHVQELAAIAVAPQGGGPSRLIICVALHQTGSISKDALHKSMQQAIRSHLNPLFKIHDLLFVAALPRTASNKVMRRKLRDLYQETEHNS